MMYYFISLKWTYPDSAVFTLWRPNSSGYCWFKEWAGLYDAIKVYSREVTHSQGIHPVESEVADKLFRRAVYDKKLVNMLPNTPATRKKLGIKKGHLSGGMSQIRTQEITWEDEIENLADGEATGVHMGSGLGSTSASEDDNMNIHMEGKNAD